MNDIRSEIKIIRMYCDGINLKVTKEFDGTPIPPLKIDFNYDRNFMPSGLLEAVLRIQISPETDDPAFTLSASLVGRFEQDGDGKLTLQDFAKFNAPAIMFPFLREIIYTVMLKTGYPPIILPPVNFIKAFSRHIKQKDPADCTQ